MTSLYCVFGHPVAHSRSPFIHHSFARQFDIDLHYEKREAPVDGFAEALKTFQEEGGVGANVTVPFKQEAMRLTSSVTQRAQQAGAVNTLVLSESGDIVGDNTDGVGLKSDLLRLDAPLKNARIAILGAGGAVRGILGPLLEADPKQILIANRTLSRAQELLEGWKDEPRLEAIGLDDFTGEFDLIINGTSASLHNEMPATGAASLAEGGFGYDMVYSAKPTPFMQWVTNQGAGAADGLGMLVGQAAESFYLWRGVRPDVESVMKALRLDLSSSS